MSEPLRLATVDDGGGPRPAVLSAEHVYAIAGAPRGERALIDLIADWARWERPAREAAARGERIARARVLAPLQYPSTFLLAGSNYGKHAGEMRAREGRSDPGPSTGSGQAIGQPYLFALPTRHVIVETGHDVVVPPWAADIDWEVELAVVIGTHARGLTASNAREAVFGYTILNDVTSRRATRRDDGPFKHDWLSGKGIATFCPMGPCVVPKSDLAEPFHLRLTVNGETMQDGDTNDLVFGIDELVAYVSQRLPLEPGDVISTGTPGGVGAGRGVFLKDGDEMVASIAGIGELRNRIVAASTRKDA